MRTDTVTHVRPAARIESAAELPQPVTRPTPRPSQRPARRPSAPPEAASAGGDRAPDEIQRWTARRRMALVLSILKGELSQEEGAERHGLTLAEIGDWTDRMLMAAHNALRSRPRDEDAMKEEQIRRLKQKVGELVIEVDVLREALGGVRSNGDGEASDD